MEKLNRIYRLEVQGNDNSVHVFEYPFTLEFAIQRAILSSANTATFRIFNLGQPTRNKIYKDAFDIWTFRSVKLFAGYANDAPTPLIFAGNIKEAKSYRKSGSTNFITEISAYDYGFAMNQAYSKISLKSDANSVLTTGAVVDSLVQDMIKSVPDQSLAPGAITDIKGTIPAPRGYSYIGKTWPELINQTGGRCFIDNGVINILDDNDLIQGDINLIDSTTGLLAPPNKADQKLSVQILFEPKLKIGQQINLQSRSYSMFNGLYKVVGLEHYGMISGAVGGECQTNVSLFLPFYKTIQLISELAALVL